MRSLCHYLDWQIKLFLFFLVRQIKDDDDDNDDDDDDDDDDEICTSTWDVAHKMMSPRKAMLLVQRNLKIEYPLQRSPFSINSTSWSLHQSCQL